MTSGATCSSNAFMNTDVIQNLMGQVGQRQYRIKVGDRISIPMPRIPMTRDTQYLSISPKIKDPKGSVIMETHPRAGEGHLGADRIDLVGSKLGECIISIEAADRLTGTLIQGVSPVEIILNVEV